MLQEADVKILGPAQVMPGINNVMDRETQSVNDIISGGQIAEITGKWIKVVGDDPLVGIYFINADTEERNKCKTIVINEPQKLLIQIPNLSKGVYYMEIVTQYSVAKRVVKEIVSTQFHLPLRIV